MDNQNTHNPGSLYETYLPEIAKNLWNRFEFVYTLKHGSWLYDTDRIECTHKTVPKQEDREYRYCPARGESLGRGQK